MEEWNNATPVKLSELKEGDTVIVDAGFTCIDPFTTKVVRRDRISPALYITCEAGQHFLDGQLDFEDHNTLVGVRKV